MKISSLSCFVCFVDGRSWAHDIISFFYLVDHWYHFPTKWSDVSSFWGLRGCTISIRLVSVLLVRGTGRTPPPSGQVLVVPSLPLLLL